MPWPDSPRNRRTGPGSRGGHWHEPLYRMGYYAGYRAGHATYGESEARRRRLQRRRERLERDRLEVEAEIARLDSMMAGDRVTFPANSLERGHR